MKLQWKEAKGSRTFNENTPLILSSRMIPMLPTKVSLGMYSNFRVIFLCSFLNVRRILLTIGFIFPKVRDAALIEALIIARE